MSTRANIVIKDEGNELIFYRHSDGYPKCTGESLKQFVKGYASQYRDNVMQSAGWLIIHGHNEYKKQDEILGLGSAFDWQVGAYEPTNSLHIDVEYIYTIDLGAKTLTCVETNGGFWESPTMENTRPCAEFPDYSFGVQS